MKGTKGQIHQDPTQSYVCQLKGRQRRQNSKFLLNEEVKLSGINKRLDKMLSRSKTFKGYKHFKETFKEA